MKVARELDRELEEILRRTIRQELTPRHVPHAIYKVSEIPYTRSGKKLELTVTKILNLEPIDNLSVVSNSSCLEEYEKIASKL